MDNNMDTAASVLSSTCQHGTRAQVESLASHLLEHRVGVQTLDIVNRNAEVLPADFIAAFISHCCTACEHAPDAYSQSRMVRLVATFLSRLVSKGLLEEAAAVEATSFALSFAARVKEAASLYRALKAAESSASSKGR